MSNKIIKDKCPNCGYRLKYDVNTAFLYCESCNSKFDADLTRINLEEKELDFKKVIKSAKAKKPNQNIVYLKCNECGSNIEIFSKNTMSLSCPYCGSNKLIEEKFDDTYIEIAGIVPFRFDVEEANKMFVDYVKGKKMAPKALKIQTIKPRIFPLYLPVYTFDTLAITEYTGKKGIDRTIERVIVDAEGKKHTVRDTVTDWYYVSGNVRSNFDDVFVVASLRDSQNKHIVKISKFDLKSHGYAFNPNMLLGYYSKIADISPQDAFTKAKEQMIPVVRRDIKNDIGGDHQRILTEKVDYTNVKCKQVLSPVYTGFYTYANVKYYFAINAQTRRISADVPYSKVKVFLAIFIPISIILAIIIAVIINN